MTRWTAITAPDPVPWHPDEYDIRFERCPRTADCNVHRIIDGTMFRKHPIVHVPCGTPGSYKVYANGILLGSRYSCAVHLNPDLWLPHAHYAAGIRPHRIGGHAITPGPVTFGTSWSHRW